jgi:hypothetical protein
MMSLAAMYRATGDRAYLDRLAAHADAVMSQRDHARGVTDYRGISTACWRNTSYQVRPYCYVVHSGMIAYPVAELVRLIGACPDLADVETYDGTTYAAKTTSLLAAAEEVVAAHDDQFVPSGNAGDYIFRPDANFLTYAGSPVPLNQQNAMGRLLVTLWQITGNPDYLDKAQRLAIRLRSAISLGGNGEYLWNYWGGSYSAPGEDISHAAINVGFAALAASAGIEFDEDDLEAFAHTFVVHVYVDDATLSNNVGGGGGVNGSSYKPQAGRWLILAPIRTVIYQAVRNYYDREIDPVGVDSGWTLLGWAYLAEFEPPLCEQFFYDLNWADMGSYMEATAQDPYILTIPPDPTLPCLVPLSIATHRTVTVSQYDGEAYHANAVWLSTGGSFVDRLLAYEPRWHYEYWNGGDLYQFEDAFVPGEGVRVEHPVGRTAPVITSTARTTAEIGSPYSYDDDGLPAATGDEPLWWSVTSGPAEARLDPAIGELSWVPDEAGSVTIVLRVANDLGFAEQSFTVEVVDPNAPDGGTSGDAGEAGDGGSSADNIVGGCGCSAGTRSDRGAIMGGGFLLLLGFWRTRSPPRTP